MRETSNSKPNSNSTSRDAISPDVGKANSEAKPNRRDTVNAIDGKTDALLRAFTNTNPDNMLGRCAFLLAQLTSADKLNRELAKQRVREMVKTGNDLLAKDKAEQKLADWPTDSDYDHF